MSQWSGVSGQKRWLGPRLVALLSLVFSLINSFSINQASHQYRVASKMSDGNGYRQDEGDHGSGHAPLVRHRYADGQKRDIAELSSNES